MKTKTKATVNTPTYLINKCRGCGGKFVVSKEAIQEVRDSYPDESLTTYEAVNIIEFCEECAGII